MRRPNHNTCILEWGLVDGIVEVTLVPSVPKDLRYSHQTRRKIPGGGNDGAESVRRTGWREFKDETGRSVRQRVKPTQLHHTEERGHIKVCFLVPRSGCRGELRTEILDDGSDTLLPPIRVSLDEAIKTVYHTPKNTFHLDSLLAAKEVFIAKGFRTGPSHAE